MKYWLLGLMIIGALIVTIVNLTIPGIFHLADNMAFTTISLAVLVILGSIREPKEKL